MAIGVGIWAAVSSLLLSAICYFVESVRSASHVSIKSQGRMVHDLVTVTHDVLDHFNH